MFLLWFKNLHATPFLRFSVLFFALLLFSCGEEEKNKQAATYGKLQFGAENSLKFIAGSEKKTFEYFYGDAHLMPFYLNEKNLFQSFLNDTLKLIIAYRDFDSSEKKFLFARQITPYTTVIGLEGMTLIVNPESDDTTITVEEFKQLLTGEGDSVKSLQNKWKDIVFDEAGSSGLRYVDSLLGKEKLSDRCFTKNNTEETIDFVSKNKNAIGVISFGVIADKEDPRAMVNRNKIKIVHVSVDGKEYFHPCQRNFVNWKYPFTRRIYMHTSDYNGSLAMGFISFVSGEEGQLIIKRGGLLPARLSWRDMNVVYENVNVK